MAYFIVGYDWAMVQTRNMWTLSLERESTNFSNLNYESLDLIVFRKNWGILLCPTSSLPSPLKKLKNFLNIFPHVLLLSVCCRVQNVSLEARINVNASLWNLHCFMGTWGYNFKPPTRKMTKRSQDVNQKGYLSCAICLFLVAAAFLMSSEIY